MGGFGGKPQERLTLVGKKLRSPQSEPTSFPSWPRLLMVAASALMEI